MMQKVFPIRSANAPAPAYDGTVLADTLGRGLRDLRISVTDRCNFRCVYCMPRDIFGSDYPFLARSELLSFEEIARLLLLETRPARKEGFLVLCGHQPARCLGCTKERGLMRFFGSGR